MSLSVSRPRPTTAFVVAVTGARRGVGTTSVAINLAVALARLGRQVALFDADAAPAAGPGGLTPGTIARAAADCDFLILDAPNGTDDAVTTCAGLIDYALIVTSDDTAAIAEAYAAIKRFTRHDRERTIGVLVNATRGARQAEFVFSQLARAAEGFLLRSIRYDGFVIDDVRLRATAFDAARTRTGDVATGATARCFERLASRLVACRSPHPDPGPGAPALAFERGRRARAFAEASRCA